MRTQLHTTVEVGRHLHSAVIGGVHVPADLGLGLGCVGAHRALEGPIVLETCKSELLGPAACAWRHVHFDASQRMDGDGSRARIFACVLHLPGVARTLSPATKRRANCLGSGGSTVRARQAGQHTHLACKAAPFQSFPDLVSGRKKKTATTLGGLEL
jgi:hypothetical protein